MAPRTITVCEDETFHPAICLVGLEPVSNFILLERYAENRSAASWTAALQAALTGLPVAVIQATSDEAKGLCRHVKTDLGAHHAPDLFHVQHEVAKATGLSLSRAVTQAEQAVIETQRELSAQPQAQADYEALVPRPGGRPPAFAPRIDSAQQQCIGAQQALEQAQAQRTEANAQLHELSSAYHPYDLVSGQAQPSERVAERLQAGWATLNRIAEEAHLPERCRQQLRKAQRMTDTLLATISFFFITIQAKIEALNLPLEVETAVYHQLIPAIYLDRMADKTTSTDQRQALRQHVVTLLAPLQHPDHILNQFNDEQRQVVEHVASECADLF